MIIGIIGGGQLGMMLAVEAYKLGHQVVALDPNEKAPISTTDASLLTYPFESEEGIKKLSKRTDVICYEFENIDLSLLNLVKDKLPQGMKALEISRDRLLEKTFAQNLGIKVPRFMAVDRTSHLQRGFVPSILKTRRFGYDGKGQTRLNQQSDLKNINIETPSILEEKIDFNFEVSIIVSSDQHNQCVFYPVIKNVHKEGILALSKPWWNAPEHLKKEAYGIGKKIVEALDYVGTLAIEFFVKDEHLIFNEMAPRPHNSGHFSIEGTTVSQFKNMILALTGKSCEIPQISKPSMMINVLGQHPYLKKSYGDDIYLHDYFKDSQKINRKIGHITVLAENDQALDLKVKRIIGEKDAD